MLALAEHRESLCPNCGGRLVDTTAAENETRYQAEAIRCFRCLAFSHNHDVYKEDQHPHSLLHLVPHEPR
jgi:uncharacterized protein with PIN domain